MIGLCVISRLHQLHIGRSFKERIRSFLFEERFHIVEHGFAQRTLQDNFITTSIGIEEVSVDLAELLIHIVDLEINEFILDVSDREEGPHSISELQKKRPGRVVGVLVGEGGLGVGEGLVKVHFVPQLIHFIWIIIYYK